MGADEQADNTAATATADRAGNGRNRLGMASFKEAGHVRRDPAEAVARARRGRRARPGGAARADEPARRPAWPSRMWHGPTRWHGEPAIIVFLGARQHEAPAPRRARRSFGCVAKRAAAPREATNAPPSRRFAARIGRADAPRAPACGALRTRVRKPGARVVIGLRDGAAKAGGRAARRRLKRV
ncbi:hypothetical protein, partial [Burkholderia pseudomallei]|uniref:hypothetical protein n=1 Tax=Burkholderia pseudomallei TaxID=28450 RepID=UPI001C377501